MPPLRQLRRALLHGLGHGRGHADAGDLKGAIGDVRAVWTQMEGTMTAGGDSFTLYPNQGKYKVADNCNSSRNYSIAAVAAPADTLYFTERPTRAWTAFMANPDNEAGLSFNYQGDCPSCVRGYDQSPGGSGTQCRSADCAGRLRVPASSGSGSPVLGRRELSRLGSGAGRKPCLP